MASAKDRYQFLMEVGRGGMGVVYKAKDRKLGRIVALKRVLPQGNKAIIDRFRVEANSIAALNHPNIIQIFDIGEDQDGLYITTEFVEGKNLARVLGSEGPLNHKAAAKIILLICKAMLYAHNKGVIHRDIKPGNILLGGDGQPKIVDFGLARHESMKDLEVTGMVMGTQSYAAPEQFTDAKHVDHRADIYAVGAVLYEMLTGTSPKFFRQELIPAPFGPLIRKAMQPDRERRYQSLEPMINDLLAAIKELNRAEASPEAQRPAAKKPSSDLVSPISKDEMILIPGGPFLFGPHKWEVTLPDYFIDKYPVTNEWFAKFFPDHQFDPAQANHPVTKVTWTQADKFARKVGKRLPSEAEWEKAARGTTGQRFPWGNEFSADRCNGFDSGIGTTTPVNTYPGGASPYGVMDMAGNAWEWTATPHEKMQSFRILKGGSYDGAAKFMQCHERFAHHPAGMFQASGFRCAKNA